MKSIFRNLHASYRSFINYANLVLPIPLIPRFIIIGSTGMALENSAMRLSNGEALLDQLIELLDLEP